MIAPEWVLTAGHVAAGLFSRHGMDYEIFVDGETEGYAISQIVIHSEFREMGPKDLALIRLSRPVEGVQPASIYRLRDEPGKDIIIVGHGDTKPGNGGTWNADGMKRGATNIIDSVTDAHILFDFDSPAEATELEGTAGPGDSGGPAFIVFDDVVYLAGVSSLGEPGAHGPGTYGAREHYVRVSSHVNWVDDIMSNPPSEAVVNIPGGEGRSERVVQGSPGSGMPPGMQRLEEIGLIVTEQDGRVRMAGRVDQLFPKSLLDGGIRPPAIIESLDGTAGDVAPPASGVNRNEIPSGGALRP